jgi:hypothetical protein
MLDQYKYLIGKNKEEVVSILGQEFNFYPANIWTYEIHKTLWGKEVILYLDFQNDVVFNLKVKISYWKF